MKKKYFIVSVIFFFCTLCSIESNSQKKKQNKGIILILAEKNIQKHQDYRFHQRILDSLKHKQGDHQLVIREFKTIAELAPLLQEIKKEVPLVSIYIFLNHLNYLQIINYHKRIFQITKKLKQFSQTRPKFYLYETNILVTFFYHSFLRYVSNINLINNTKEFLKLLEPNMKYYMHKFDYKKKKQIINLKTKKQYLPMKHKCIPYWKSETISLKQTHQNKSHYNIMPPPIHQVIVHDSFFYCFFKNTQKKNKIIYKIIYPKIDFSLFPREIVVFYEPKKIIEKKININSEIAIKNLKLTINVDKLKGKPPLLFSHNKKWDWNPTSKKFSLINYNDKKESHQFNLEKKYIIDLAVIGKENSFLSGTLQVANEGFPLIKIPFVLKPYFWSAHLLSIVFIYFKESLLFISLLFIGIIFFLRKKKIKRNNNRQLGEAMGEFIFMFKKSQQFFLSKNDNPFNCMIPFIDESYIIKIDGAYIDILPNNKKKEKQSFNLNESLGKSQYNLGTKGEILFSQEKFHDKNNQSIIIMKVREKVT